MTKGLLCLLVFTPLAFGTVQPWSIAIMEILSFGIFILHVWKAGVSLPESRTSRAVLILLLLFISLVLLQILPLPDSTLGMVSPAALETWRTLGNALPGAYHTVSLYPDATRQELLKVLAYIAVFFVVVREHRSRAQVRLLVKTILFMGGFLAVFAIVQKLTWNGRIFWVFPISEMKRSGSGIWGPYINRNHFAGYLAMTIPLGFGFLMSLISDDKISKGTTWRRRLGRFLASDGISHSAGIFLLISLMSACLVSTKSRGAVAALVVSLFFLALFSWRRRLLRSRALVLVLAMATLGAVVLLPAWDRIEQRFDDIREKDQIDRLYLLNDSLAIIKSFPLFGTGLGTFSQAYRRYQTTNPRLFFDHAHNDYLELATDTGLIGLLLGMGITGVFSFSMIRAWRRNHSRFSICIGCGGLASCLAIGVHSGSDFNLHIPANALLFTVIAGLTHAVVQIPQKTASSPFVIDSAAMPHTFYSRKPLLKHVAAFLATLLLYLPASDLLADHHYRKVGRILDDESTVELDIKPIDDSTIGSYLNALNSLERAAELKPSRSVYPQTQAELYARLGEWAKIMESMRAPLPEGAPSGKEGTAHAVAASERAIFLEPTNPNLHLALGQLYLSEDGNFTRAETQIRQALAAHPVNSSVHYSIAMLYLLAGRKVAAFEQARALAQLDDSYLTLESARKTFMIENRKPIYLNILRSSYLFQAFEIAWRATGNIDLVKSIAPINDDAKAVLELFWEWKGITE